jgi:hypothetical protein
VSRYDLRILHAQAEPSEISAGRPRGRTRGTVSVPRRDLARARTTAGVITIAASVPLVVVVDQYGRAVGVAGRQSQLLGWIVLLARSDTAKQQGARAFERTIDASRRVDSRTNP